MLEAGETRKDLTKYMMQYRECSRHVWNTYFTDIDLGSTFFNKVDEALFDGLVLSEFNYDISYPSPKGYIEQIEVRFKRTPAGSRVMFAFPTDAYLTEWAERRLYTNEYDLRFIGFFDFVNDGEARDLRYTRVRALSIGEAPELAGADLLIPAEWVNFFGVTEING
jgi:hypothetical protein